MIGSREQKIESNETYDSKPSKSPTAEFAVELILTNDFKKILEGMALLEKYPEFLRPKMQIKDGEGRILEGRPLEILAMRGETEFEFTIEGIFHDRDRGGGYLVNAFDQYKMRYGLMERIISNPRLLSLEEIREQLSIVTSKEAKEENEKRINGVLDATKIFWKALFENEFQDYSQLEEFKKQTPSIIQRFEINLRSVLKERDLDPIVLVRLIKWFESEKLSEVTSLLLEEASSKIIDYKLKLFFINGYGKLQSLLSPRHKAIFYQGVEHFNENFITCSREKFEKDNYFSPFKGLGIDYYLGSSRQILQTHPCEIETTYELGKRASRRSLYHGNIFFGPIKKYCELIENRLMGFSQHVEYMLNPPPPEKSPEQLKQKILELEAQLKKEQEKTASLKHQLCELTKKAPVFSEVKYASSPYLLLPSSDKNQQKEKGLDNDAIDDTFNIDNIPKFCRIL